MSSEITLRLSFPKTGHEDIIHNFVLNKEAASILEFAISKYPEIPASSQIYMLNSSKKFSYVTPEEILSSLDLQNQHQILILPNEYKIEFIYMEGETEKSKYLLDCTNESYVAEKLAYICLKNNLYDPSYYVVSAGNKDLVQDESITEQAPYAKSLIFRLLPQKSLYDVLIREFLDSTLICSLKDKQMIVMYILYINYGPYKASQRQQYDQKIKDSIPKAHKDDSSFQKSLLKSVIDIYKQAKAKEDPTNECIEFIMGLPNFSSIVVNGYRGSVTKKRQVKPTKVTFSLNYSILRVFKFDTVTLLEEYKIADMLSPKMDNPTSFQFDFDNLETKTRTSVQCRIEDQSTIFRTLMERCQSLASNRNAGSSGSHIRGARGVISKGLQVPAFILGFNLFTDVPRISLNYTILRATFSIMQVLEPLAEEFSQACEAQKEPPRLHGLVKVGTSLLTSFNSKAALKLFKSYEDSRTSFAEYRQACATASLPTKDKKAAKEAQTLVTTKELDFKTVNACFAKESMDILEDLEKILPGSAQLDVRPVFVKFIHSSLFLLFLYSWVNESDPCREQIDKLKQKIVSILKVAGSIAAYSSDPKKFLHNISRVVKYSAELVPHIEKVPNPDQKIISDLLELETEELKTQEKAIKKFYKDSPPVTVVPPMDSDIEQRSPEDPRPLYKESKTLIDSLLNARIDDLTKANEDLSKLRFNLVSLLEMAPQTTHEPLILAFNDFKADIERNYATYGSNNVTPSALRCQKTLDNIFNSLNPADELKQQLKQFPITDPRVVALLPIIAYLSVNGPLYQGSTTQLDIQKFIAQMPMGKTSSLLDLAFSIESAVPEELRKLTDTCDPTKGLYNEVDERMEISDVIMNAKAATKTCGKSAIEVREILRNKERETAKKYRTLNLALWRTVNLFNQIAIEEESESVGNKAFISCRDSFKTLLEESAYDMKRQRKFLPFIDEFTNKVNKVIESPRDSQSLAELGGFLMLYQTRPGFYIASKALAEFNHFVLVTDSNHAAQKLLNDAMKMMIFRKASLMIATLKRRFQTLLAKVDLAMKTKLQTDQKRSDIDLRADYQTFLIKYTDQLFIIFSQLVVANTTNVEALQKLSTGCDAIERLFPSIMNVEIPAPYLGRSVCGIVFSSMESLHTQCREMGGKVQQSGDEAFLAVREFLFIIRRKIADAEKDKSALKTGIGIADMYAVIDRDNKMINAQAEFQRSIRKRRW